MRSLQWEPPRVCDLKPFYRGASVTVIGAISLKKVVALMTLNGSMDGTAFQQKTELEKVRRVSPLLAQIRKQKE